MLYKVAFSGALLLASLSLAGNKFEKPQSRQKLHKNGFYAEKSHEDESASEAAQVYYEGQAWQQFFDYQSNVLQDNHLVCIGCSIAFDAFDALIQTSLVQGAIIGTLTAACEFSGVVGDRFKICP